MTRGEPGVFPIEFLHEFSTRVFRHFGVPEADAAQAADVLACADLRGIDSHGIARLHRYWCFDQLKRVNACPRHGEPSTTGIRGRVPNRIARRNTPGANLPGVRRVTHAQSRPASKPRDRLTMGDVDSRLIASRFRYA